jgi:hypothetical protein
VTAARGAAARAKPAPIVLGAKRDRAEVGTDGTTRPRPRSDDARDESAIEADGACGAGAAGFRPRSENTVRHCREQSERHRATEGRARAEGATL